MVYAVSDPTVGTDLRVLLGAHNCNAQESIADNASC